LDQRPPFAADVDPADELWAPTNGSLQAGQCGANPAIGVQLFYPNADDAGA
jgi:hypothetical protein